MLRYVKLVMLVFIIVGCEGVPQGSDEVDALNRTAHRWRYRNVDSMAYYARRALDCCPEDYAPGRAEALNHLAFERSQRMDFDSALVLAHDVLATNTAPTEQLVADVLCMKVAQRTSDNATFFTHRTRALKRLRNSHSESLRGREAERRSFAEGELHIVESTYFYYVDQLDRARAAIAEAEPFCQMPADTAQWLNYCYMCGSGGLIDSPDNEEVVRREFDFLFKCFTFSKNQGYLYFEANSLQSLAALLSDSARVEILRGHKPEALIYLDIIFPQPTAKVMAEEAVELFRRYDDIFQTACALRTLGTLSADEGHYAEALRCYNDALAIVDGASVPEWEAGIWEKMSVALAGEGRMQESATARNNYLDLRWHTREDAELTSRREVLREENRRLHLGLLATLLMSVVLAAVVLVLRRQWLRRNKERMQNVAEEQRRLLAQAEARSTALADTEEQLREEREATILRIRRIKRQNIVQRAKLTLAREIIPLLDRIIHASRRMLANGRPDADALEYICELTERIDENGRILTEWIQMERGRVSLNVSSFQLEPLFATLRRSAFTFRQQGIELEIAETTLSVKADRALTLFMLNTLADNARKATPEGGRVAIAAAEGHSADGDYVELSVADTGCGLTDEQQQTFLAGRGEMHEGHGFGLMNCRGIIERYRKTSRHFAVAALGVESRVGQGSRFWFRLPKAATLMLALALVVGLDAGAAPSVRTEAYRLADSLYYANVDGRHDEALLWADSAMQAATAWHDSLFTPDGSRLSLQPQPGEAPEVQWLLRGDTLDFQLLLALRNEAAVAALATRQWDIYAFNNHVYTRLYKLLNQDHTLEADCQRLERAQQGQRMTLWAMLALIIIAAVAAYLFWLRPHLQLRRAREELNRQRFEADLAEQHEREQQQMEDVELAEDEHRRRLYEESRLHVQNQIMDNCLSTIKHETLYYPGRIRRLAQQVAELPTDQQSEGLRTLTETATYCREVYAAFIAQGEQQASQLPFRITRVERLGQCVRADAELLDMLLDTILAYERRLSPEADITVDAAPTADGRFVRFAITNPQLSFDENRRNELFSPHEGGGFEMLVCKQIVRELDTMLHHVGCRIQADPTPDARGHIIWFTLINNSELKFHTL